jgi:hypothetical protein
MNSQPNIIQLRPHQIEAYREAHSRDEVKVRSIPPRVRHAVSTEISTAELFRQAPALLAKAVARGWAKLSKDKTPVRIPDKQIRDEATRRNMAEAHMKYLKSL